MGRFVNPDNSAFQAALNSEIYVDKTGLLENLNKKLDTMQGYICNSRPRRFGKSLTANMLTAYYSCGCDSKEMFSNLAIGKMMISTSILINMMLFIWIFSGFCQMQKTPAVLYRILRGIF